MQEPTSTGKRVRTMGWEYGVYNYLNQRRYSIRTSVANDIREAAASMPASQFLAYLDARTPRINDTIKNELRAIVGRGGGRQTRARRFDISPIPRLRTRRRSLTPSQLQMVRYQGTPPRRTRPAEDAAPRRGVYVRRAVFEAALDDAIEGMEAYTEDDREELRESFLRVADELYNEGRFEMQFGKNKENYEENLKKVAKEIDLVELGKKAVRGAAMDKVLRKALRLV